jgi:hypothetical protein
MFERLMNAGTALARAEARKRRRSLADAIGESAPAGVRASESEQGVVLSGRGLGRRLALEPGLRWLVAWRGR